MPENKDQDHKTKAPLIKHQKTEVQTNHEDNSEKKKVVVVKKKAVPVKKKIVVHTEPGNNKENVAEANSQVGAEKDTPSNNLRPSPRDPLPNEKLEIKAPAKTIRPSPRESALGQRIDPSKIRAQRAENAPPRPATGEAPRGYRQNSGPGTRPPAREGGGYAPRPSNYPPREDGRGGYAGRSDSPARPGGYRPEGGPRPGGYRPGTAGPGRTDGGAPPTRGGYQGRPGGPGAGRPGGFTPGSGRPGGFGGPGRGPGGFRPGGGRPTDSPPPMELGKGEPKKFRSKKDKDKSYQMDKEKEGNLKKVFQNSKKSSAKANPIPKSIDIMEVITVSELARKLNLKASDIISKLMALGVMATINQQIDAETATIVASEFGAEVKIISLYDETLIESDEALEEDLEHRPPIVTIMGHVDHGKTKLLDAIRTTKIAEGEHGGITQHIGAYQVETEKGSITFLDTPGHEAFTLMRARGAQVTDIVVLVVAANDGVMPQTVEAIHHAKEAGVPIIVAVNKIDLPEANPDKVKQQLSDHGLMPESWGGSTMFVEISALKKMGIDELLDGIILQAEVLELRASKKTRAEGKVIESKIDQGRGVVATVLIEKGQLKIADAFIGGVFPGKVRAMFNDRGESIKVANPSTPVEILGFSGIPSAGDPFQVTESEKQARQIGLKRQELKRHEGAKNVKKVTLDNLYDSISDGEIKELKVIVKGDVQGSVEALKNSLEKLSNKEIRLVCIHASAGAIIENDVYLAAASDAIIIGFHVRPTPKALMIADQEKVEVRKYNIIYDAVEDIKLAMEGMLSPDLREDALGTAEVRDTFKVPKIGVIAGCYVQSGKVKRNCLIRVFREGVQIHEGKISSLRRFKDDVKEVATNYECGIGIENFQDLQVGDSLEAYEIVEVAKKLGD